MHAKIVDHLIPADLAKPTEKGCIAAILSKVTGPFCESCLHDLFGRFSIAANPWKCEAIHAGKIGVKERAEGPLVSLEHGFHKNMVRIRRHSKMHRCSDLTR